MQDKTPTRGFSSSHHVRTDGNAIPHIPRRHTSSPHPSYAVAVPPTRAASLPTRAASLPTRAAWRAPHSCGMACTPLVPRCGRARCPHRAAAPHGAVRGFASCDNRVWGTHAHYTTIFARALHTATGRCGAMGTSRPTAITHAMPHALCPWGLPTARGGATPSCAMPKNENGPEWKTIPTRGDKAQKAISPCCS